jgi:hypothetical protein
LRRRETRSSRQILAAGNLSEAQVEASRRFQRRKGLTFGEAAITLGLVRRDSLFLALSKAAAEAVVHPLPLGL